MTALDADDHRVIDYLCSLLSHTGTLPDDDLERWLWIAHAWADWKADSAEPVAGGHRIHRGRDPLRLGRTG